MTRYPHDSLRSPSAGHRDPVYPTLCRPRNVLPFCASIVYPDTAPGVGARIRTYLLFKPPPRGGGGGGEGPRRSSGPGPGGAPPAGTPGLAPGGPKRSEAGRPDIDAAWARGERDLANNRSTNRAFTICCAEPN